MFSHTVFSRHDFGWMVRPVSRALKEYYNISINVLKLFNVFVQAADNEEEPEGRASSEEESSDDDKSWVEEVREQRRLLWQEGRDRRRQERKDADRNTVLEKGGEKTSNMAESKKTSQPQFYQIKAGEEFRSFNDMARKQKLQKYVFGNVLNGTLTQCWFIDYFRVYSCWWPMFTLFCILLIETLSCRFFWMNTFTNL